MHVDPLLQPALIVRTLRQMDERPAPGDSFPSEIMKKSQGAL